MKLLAIDTATDCLALAAVEAGPVAPGRVLARADCRIEALDLEGGPAASARALPALQDLLARLGWGFGDLHAIAFGRGPGGFTGLRTACAIAQGLAFGLGLPVVPVDSLALVAEDALRQHGCAGNADAGPVWVLMDARMDEIYAGCYRPDGLGGWACVEAPALTTPEALNAVWGALPPAWIAGSALPVFGDRLAPAGAIRVPDVASRASALGWLAATGHAQGQTLPAHQALPLYLRDKVALTTAERLAARAAVEVGR